MRNRIIYHRNVRRAQRKPIKVSYRRSSSKNNWLILQSELQSVIEVNTNCNRIKSIKFMQQNSSFNFAA